ncbi:hypothetical protein AB4233_02945 [Vibrio sp. 10N.286.45.F3]|uniref:hypothetical protein n=1 Tax=unclassified Vibrio TaxID=2614977 RepID=UPI001A7E0823|nr:hypothetical protein [Vibrio sp. 10N.261.45.A1]
MVLPLSVLAMHDEKRGSAGFMRFTRLRKAFFESLHPSPNPVGKHIQMPHSASLAALTCEL